DLIRHASISRRVARPLDRRIRSLRAVLHYWRAETLDTSVIERLARLRGIGDAYHDYRGELRYFSLETKVGLLRAMGCAVEDPAALGLELTELEIGRWRALLPPVAAAN